ncbi:RHS repeat-associated core domain-containing protein [Methylocaldum sp. RMAD-M]|uniref:RHS repeat-associated core domain-containing protein n=1 Tax=Methylocaldum sp. RMAD-M TaxID=2806557 RepID=UPI001AE7A51A|nr:RHS repeat-associated core domain-containing protein [Methylocaldum sp. RMAD-M]MBP1152572.1 RHS repeat-associated protein [Methylocaldum sp. RMAD-M]
MTDASQETLNTYAYDPYGRLMATTETVQQPFQYAGQVGVMAEGQNLYYMRAQYYDAHIGRFISEDPIGFDGGLNLYAYVGGNPIMAVDPSGLGAESFYLPSLPQDLVDFAAGFGDVLSFGGTYIIREVMDTNSVVDFSSSAYATGAISGVAIHTIGFRTGGELSIGRNFRLAPWGNRTGNRYGELPHYHRRGVDQSGQTLPGQGIGRHRPWESKSTDTSFWSRF